jgi:hypothetical protein
LPSRISWATPGTTSTITSTRPAISSPNAGPLPRNGTCCHFTPVRAWKYSPLRCCRLPLPADAILSAPGDFLESAINSSTLAAGSPLRTTSTVGLLATSTIGTSRASGSKSRFLNSTGLMVTGPVLENSSV